MKDFFWAEVKLEEPSYSWLRKPKSWSLLRRQKLNWSEYCKVRRSNRGQTIFTTFISKTTISLIIAWIIPSVRAGRPMIDHRPSTFATIPGRTSRFLTWSNAWLRCRTCGVVLMLYGEEGHNWRLLRTVGMQVVEDRDLRASIISPHMVLMHKLLLMMPNRDVNLRWLHRIHKLCNLRMISNHHHKS